MTFNSYQRENSLDQKYLYNGKELQNELDLGWLDYGLRMYQPELGRWHAIDPLVEKYMDVSPYAYVANNPMLFVDPNGAEIWLSYTYRNENDEEVTSRYQYKNGKLYTENGDEYDGSDGADPIFQLVTDQLNAIKEDFADNEEIQGIYSYLEGEESGEHTIQIKTEGKNSNRYKNSFTNDTVTEYNPLNQEDPEDPKKDRDPMIGLMHEMRHSYDKSKHSYDGSTDWHDTQTGERVMFSVWEARAINTENILRRRWNGSIRTTYKVKIGGKDRVLSVPERYLTN